MKVHFYTYVCDKGFNVHQLLLLSNQLQYIDFMTPMFIQDCIMFPKVTNNLSIPVIKLNVA